MQQTPRAAVDRSGVTRQQDYGAARSSTLEEGLILLNSFHPGEDWLPLPEVARRTSLPKSTVRRLVEELTEHGFLEHGSQGVRLGEHLFVLGLRAPGPRHLRAIARPALDALQSATGASAYLSVLDGTEVMHLDYVRAPGPGPSTSTAKERQAVCTAAVTKVLRTQAGSETPSRLSEHHPFDGPDALEHHGAGRQDTRADRGQGSQSGEARTDGPLVLNSRRLLGVCAPVVHPRGHTLAAVTAVGPAHGVHQSVAVRHVQSTAAAIARHAAHVEGDHLRSDR